MTAPSQPRNPAGGFNLVLVSPHLRARAFFGLVAVEVEVEAEAEGEEGGAMTGLRLAAAARRARRAAASTASLRA